MNNYGAIQLNGSSQYGQLASVTDHDFGTGNFALNCSFQTTSYGPLIKRHDGANGWKIEVLNSGGIRATLNSMVFNASSNYSNGRTHHVEVSVDKTTRLGYLFVDGEMASAQDVTSLGTVTSGADLFIGRDGSSYFNGTIAEVRLSSKARNTKSYTPDGRQFEDDKWTAGLYHFNEGLGSTSYDMSEERNSLTLYGSPTYTTRLLEVSPASIVREVCWYALDTNTALTNFVESKKVKKYKYREGDTIPASYNVENSPALTIVPAAVPNITPETSAFHALTIPVEVRGYIQTTRVSEIEFFWWITLKALYSRYDVGITAGHFNWSYIQNMNPSGPSFEVALLGNSTVFCSFLDTWQFELRHDFLGDSY